MAFEHGKDTSVIVDTIDLSAYFQSANSDQSVSTAETTTFQAANGSRTYIAGQTEGSVSLDGIFDGGVDAVDEEMEAALGASAGQVLSFGSAGWTIGDALRLVLAKATSYSINGPFDDVITISASMQGDGGVVRGIALHDIATSENATLDGASVDNAASSASGGVGHLHVTTNTRDGAVTIKIQDSADDAVWADLITFTDTVASTKTVERLSVTGTVDRYIRGQVSAVGGSTGAFNFALGFARY